MDAGADVCVVSVHKMGAGFEQGSVFHQQGELVDPAVLKAREDLLGTTSPSVLLYAGLDGWRRQMVEHGHDLLQAALELAGDLRQDVERIPGMHVDHDEFLGPDRAFDLDPLQVIIDIAELGVLGYRAADWLREHHRINLHLSDHRRISAQLTYADDRDSAAAVSAALRDLVEHVEELKGGPEVKVADPRELELAVLPRDAFFGPAEQVAAERAVGRISAEMLTELALRVGGNVVELVHRDQSVVGLFHAKFVHGEPEGRMGADQNFIVAVEERAERIDLAAVVGAGRVTEIPFRRNDPIGREAIFSERLVMEARPD